jgi:hypothetical protein
MPSSGTALSPEARQTLAALLVQRYDREHGGWGFSKKFLDFDDVEYCMVRARSGDADAERMAKETLARSRKLIDRIWGGLYQYSDSGDWDHPHFEKLLQFQAEGIRIYAQAYALWRDPADLQAARDIHRYVRAFLKSPASVFYVSQDADLVAGEHSGGYYALDARGGAGAGFRVDTHLYARERLDGQRSGDALRGDRGGGILQEATTAAAWILARDPSGRRPPRHGRAAGPYWATPCPAAAPSSRCGRRPESGGWRAPRCGRIHPEELRHRGQPASCRRCR